MRPARDGVNKATFRGQDVVIGWFFAGKLDLAVPD
jgi:hypothetical protein